MGVHPGESEVDAEQRRRAYEAIGRYTVEFSMLVGSMRRMFGRYVTRDDRMRRRLVEMSLADQVGAGQVAETFFAMCRQAADLNENEQAIWRSLRKQVTYEITERNNIVHGDWLIGHWGPGVDPIRLRIKVASQDEPLKRSHLTIDELGELADRVEHLAAAIWQLGLICIYQHGKKTRVENILELKGERIVQVEGSVWIYPNPHDDPWEG